MTMRHFNNNSLTFDTHSYPEKVAIFGENVSINFTSGESAVKLRIFISNKGSKYKFQARACLKLR